MDARFGTASAATAALVARPPQTSLAAAPRTRKLAALGLTSLLAFTCAACGEAAPVTWVSAPKKTDVAFALVEGDGAVVAYVCGGSTTYATYSRWFTGPLDDSGAFSAEQDGWKLAGTIGTSLDATLTDPDGATSEYTAQRGLESSTDGLYDVEDSGCRTGVIAWTNPVGEPAVQGTWCDDKKDFQQVTPVYPIERSPKGLHVTVDLTKLNLGKRDLYVEQVPTPVAVR